MLKRQSVFKRSASIAIWIACSTLPTQVVADPDLGKRKALQACAACHGAQGLSMAPRTPHLAGQDPDYLIEQLKHYRSGKRNHQVMAVIAKSLSDEEIDAVANWYGSNRIALQQAGQ